MTKIGCSDVSSIFQDSLYTDIKLGSIYIPVLSPSVILSVFAPLVGGKQSGDSYLTPSTEGVNLFREGVKRIAGLCVFGCEVFYYI